MGQEFRQTTQGVVCLSFAMFEVLGRKTQNLETGVICFSLHTRACCPILSASWDLYWGWCPEQLQDPLQVVEASSQHDDWVAGTSTSRWPGSYYIIFKDLVLVTANLDTVLLIFKSMSAPPLMERVSASYWNSCIWEDRSSCKHLRNTLPHFPAREKSGKQTMHLQVAFQGQ